MLFIGTGGLDHINSWCKQWKLTVNCQKDKTEALILQPLKGPRIDSTSIPKLKINGQELQYVEKSKVLGLILDDEVRFVKHSNLQLKRCWHAWYNISKSTTPTRGLNHSSLTALFKSVVLTKLLYASPVWLEDNLKMFNDFWSRVILKISGAHYQPRRIIAECALGIPPLELILESVILKFCLKCYRDPTLYSLVLQLDEERNHGYHHHVSKLKSFLRWKEDSNRKVNLLSAYNSTIYYTKELIDDYLDFRWTNHIKLSLPESDILDDIEAGVLRINRDVCKKLFPRFSRRMDDSNILNILHGSSERFNSFATAVGSASRSNCPVCRVKEDSHHVLFECTKFNCRNRDIIPRSEDHKLFALKIVMAQDTYHIPAFKDMAKKIML